MDVLVVERLQLGGHIGVIAVEHRVAFAPLLPPEPILHHRVQRNMPAAVLIGDRQNLRLRCVAILGLEEPIGPLRKQRRMARHGAVCMDNPVHPRAIEHVVIHLAGGHRFKVQVQWKAVIHVGERGRVPQDSITLAGDQQGNGDIGVVLAQFQRAAPIVEEPALVLAQSIDGLGGIGRESSLDLVKPCRPHRNIGARQAPVLTEQRLALGSLEA